MGSAVAKGALAVVTLLLMASMGGGFLLLPLLVPFHLWAARTSGPIGRVLWSLLPGVTAGMVVWAAVYVSIGEAKPFIWLGPMLAAVVAVIAAVFASGGGRKDIAMVFEGSGSGSGSQDAAERSEALRDGTATRRQRPPWVG